MEDGLVVAAAAGSGGGGGGGAGQEGGAGGGDDHDGLAAAVHDAALVDALGDGLVAAHGGLQRQLQTKVGQPPVVHAARQPQRGRVHGALHRVAILGADARAAHLGEPQLPERLHVGHLSLLGLAAAVVMGRADRCGHGRGCEPAGQLEAGGAVGHRVVDGDAGAAVGVHHHATRLVGEPVGRVCVAADVVERSRRGHRQRVVLQRQRHQAAV